MRVLAGGALMASVASLAPVAPAVADARSLGEAGVIFGRVTPRSVPDTSGEFAPDTAARAARREARRAERATTTLRPTTTTARPTTTTTAAPTTTTTAAIDEQTLEGDVAGAAPVDGRNPWGRNNLTYGFMSTSPDIGPTRVKAAFRAAFNEWSRVTPLRFTEVADCPGSPPQGDPSCATPDIRIRFIPDDGPGGTLAITYFPPPNAGTKAGDATFDEDEAWTDALRDTSRSPIDLQSVALHELGHSLGLQHIRRGCRRPGHAVMCPAYTGSQRTLTQTDVAAIERLYGI